MHRRSARAAASFLFALPVFPQLDQGFLLPMEGLPKGRKAVVLERKAMTKEMPTGGACAAPPTETTRFLTTDQRAILWFTTRQGAKGDVLTREWYDPSGALYARGHWDPTADAGGYCYTVWIDIAGKDAAAKPGNWRVDIRVNGAPFFQQPFTIEQAGTPPGSTPPSIAARGVVSAADYSANLAPGSLIAIYGSNLAPSTVVADKVPLPTTLNGVSLEALDAGRTLPLPLVFVSPGQINAQLPYNLTGATVRLRARNGANVGNEVDVPVLSVAPALMTKTLDGRGEAIAMHADYKLIGADSPAAPGEVIMLYAAGLGAVNPAAEAGRGGGDGSPQSPLNRVTAPVEATINNTPAEVLFSGLAPYLVGVYQLNIKLPDILAAGPNPIVIRAGNLPARRSQTGVVIQTTARPAGGASPEAVLRQALEAQARGDIDAMLAMCSTTKFPARGLTKARQILETIRARASFRDFQFKHRATALDDTATLAIVRAEVAFTAAVKGASSAVTHGLMAELHKESEGWRLGRIYPDDPLNYEIYLRGSAKPSSTAARHSDYLTIAELNARLDHLMNTRHVNSVKVTLETGFGIVGTIPGYGDIPAYVYQVCAATQETRELVREFWDRGRSPMLTMKAQQVAAGMLQILTESMPGFDTVTDVWAGALDEHVCNLEIQRAAQELKARVSRNPKRFEPVMIGGLLNWDNPIGVRFESLPPGRIKLSDPLGKITLERPALDSRIPLLVYDEIEIPKGDALENVIKALGGVERASSYFIPMNLTPALDLMSLLPNPAQEDVILDLPSFDKGPAGEGTVVSFRVSCRRGTQKLAPRLLGGEEVSGPVVVSQAMNEIDGLELSGVTSQSLDLSVGETRRGLGVIGVISTRPRDSWPQLTERKECLSASIRDTSIATAGQDKEISITGVSQGSTTLNLSLRGSVTQPPPLDTVQNIPVQVRAGAANPLANTFALFAAFDGWHNCDVVDQGPSGTTRKKERCSPFESRMYATNQLNLATSNYEQAVPPALRLEWKGSQFTAKGSASGSYSEAGGSDEYTLDFSGAVGANAGSIQQAILSWTYRKTPAEKSYVAVTNAEFEIQNLPLSTNDTRWSSALYYAKDAAAKTALKIKKYVTTTTYSNGRTLTMTYADSDPGVSTSALVYIRGRL